MASLCVVFSLFFILVGVLQHLLVILSSFRQYTNFADCRCASHTKPLFLGYSGIWRSEMSSRGNSEAHNHELSEKAILLAQKYGCAPPKLPISHV
ncbi:hypothetical protein F5Y09DRAFT_110474 [Xylaria sp. FL1042]|nr:hypothetical protein F5Y09DRAFT_110474 [Xylaria sp. FL1042]